MKSLSAFFCSFRFLLALVCISLGKSHVSACTIASGVSRDGQVWTCNNEDGYLGVATFINVFPATESRRYGYFTLSLFSPKYGQGGNIQGGMNEAGLTFDFNAISQVKGFNPKTKKVFAQGDDNILPHILGTMTSVEEVIAFFDEYWFQNGFNSAQMHVADRSGRIAIISASGVVLAPKGQFLISTNFDICGKEDGSSCWRYPLAERKLSEHGASLETMMAICNETRQGENTLYSNVQNLTTGDVWFFSKHDPGNLLKINIADLMRKGRRSFTFSDLSSLSRSDEEVKSSAPVKITLSEAAKQNLVGNYHNDFTGLLTVEAHPDGIKITSLDGNANVVVPQSANEFFFPGEDVMVQFAIDKQNSKMKMSFFENGFWIFDAWRAESPQKH
jgi:hypothetical protein